MKRRISCLIICGMVAAGSMPVYARTVESNVSFSTGGMKLTGDKSAYNIDGKNYLPMRAIIEMLGGEVDWNKYKNEAKVVIGDKRIVIDANTMTSTVNGEPADLDVQRINGSLYLPVRLMGENFGFKVNWDEATRNIDITKKDSEYILLDTTPMLDDDTRVLTFEEALKLAEDHSSNLKNLDDSVDVLDDSRKSLKNTMIALDRAYNTLSDTLLSSLASADMVLNIEMQLEETAQTGITLARSMKQVDVQQSLTKVREEMIEDGLEITLLSQINAIKGSEIQLKLLEESVALGAEGLENTRLKNSLGYASDVELKKAELAQEELEKNLTLLEESIATQREALNNTLGLNASDKIYVAYDKEVSDLSDFKLEPYIMKQRESAPSIKVLDGNVSIAEYALRTNPGLVNESKKSARSELNTASRALNDGKDTLEKNIRSAYHQLQQLALKDKQLKLAVEEAKTDYNSAVVSYNAGMATEYTVKQARLGVLNAEKAVEDNKLSYIMLSATFEKPYLLGGQ